MPRQHVPRPIPSSHRPRQRLASSRGFETDQTSTSGDPSRIHHSLSEFEIGGGPTPTHSRGSEFAQANSAAILGSTPVQARREAGKAGAFASEIPHSGVGSFLDQAGGGRPLPGEVRSQMEGSFGQDFSDVRVFEGQPAESIRAEAFTRGHEIHFAPGQYRPQTYEGKKLIGHELAHVVQQRAGRVRPSGGLSPIVEDLAHEREADMVSERIVRGGRSGPDSSPSAMEFSGGSSAFAQAFLGGSGLAGPQAAGPSSAGPAHQPVQMRNPPGQDEDAAPVQDNEDNEAERLRAEAREADREKLSAMFEILDGDNEAEKDNQISQQEFDRITDVYSSIREGNSRIKLTGSTEDNQLDENDLQDFQTGALNDIARIMRSSSGREVIDAFHGGNHDLNLLAAANMDETSTDPIDPAAAKDGTGTGSNIQYMPGVRSDKGQTHRVRATSDTILFHEMLHGYYNMQGQNANEQEVDVDQDLGGDQHHVDAGLPQEEYRAAGLGRFYGGRLTENKYREQQQAIEEDPDIVDDYDERLTYRTLD